MSSSESNPFQPCLLSEGTFCLPVQHLHQEKKKKKEKKNRNSTPQNGTVASESILVKMSSCFSSLNEKKLLLP